MAPCRFFMPTRPQQALPKGGNGHRELNFAQSGMGKGGLPGIFRSQRAEIIGLFSGMGIIARCAPNDAQTKDGMIGANGKHHCGIHI